MRDRVIVIAGRDKGMQGEILDINYAKGRVRVKGVALVKKHAKARRQGEASKIKTKESYVALSNVMPIASDGKPTRVRYKGASGKKVRVATRTGATLD